MVPTFGAPGGASSAVRWTGAVTASLALHAAVGFGLTVAPPGSPIGSGSLASHPLQARIVSPPAAPPPLAVQSNAATATKKPAPPDRASSTAAPTDPAPPLGLGGSPIYYPPSELDVRPRLTTRVDPVYPRVAPPDGGYLVLRLLIDEQGFVERTIIVLADPEGYFEEATTEAFAAARFAPGRRGGVAVKSQLWIEMKFRPVAPPGTASARAGELSR
jgi:protein TonB